MVKWHEGALLLDNVINQESEGIIAGLHAVIDYIVSNTEKEAFQGDNAFHQAQKYFNKFMRYAEKWQVFEFVSAMLGLLALLTLMIICIF